MMSCSRPGANGVSKLSATLAIVLTFATTLIVAQSSNVTNYIIGGTPAPPGRYPYFAYSSASIGSFSICGGTLIYEDIVLSAAHCLEAFTEGILIGGILADGSDAEFVPVDGLCSHPEYTPLDVATNTLSFNDIMLVKLAVPSTVQDFVQLNIGNPTTPLDGDPVTAIGVGNTDAGALSPVLLEVGFFFAEDDICASFAGGYLPETMLCAGTAQGGANICQGDSGGPLFSNALGAQIGVTSATLGECGQANTPAIFTEVAAFSSFISQGICALSANPPADCATVDISAFTCLGSDTPPPTDDTPPTTDDTPPTTDDTPPTTDDTPPVGGKAGMMSGGKSGGMKGSGGKSGGMKGSGKGKKGDTKKTDTKKSGNSEKKVKVKDSVTPKGGNKESSGTN